MNELNLSKENLRNEYDYFIAQLITDNLLEKGLISLSEYNKISKLNAKKFSYSLSALM